MGFGFVICVINFVLCGFGAKSLSRLSSSFIQEEKLRSECVFFVRVDRNFDGESDLDGFLF